MMIIEVETAKGDKLYGCLYGEKFKDVCVIVTNGTGGNIFENNFLQIVGEVLEANGISFIYAHNSGAFQMIDTPSKDGRRKGVTFECFDECLDDLQAFVDFAKIQGYKHIILGGHSYGANKVVFYLSQNQNEPIEKFILISPTDTTRLKESEKISAEQFMPIAEKFDKENKLDEIIPILFDGYNFFTARAFFDFMQNKNAKNLPVYSKNKDFSQLRKIKQRGLFVMGENDSFAFGDTQKHLNVINANSGRKDNITKMIQKTGHTFRGKEFELAQIILDFIVEK